MSPSDQDQIDPQIISSLLLAFRQVGGDTSQFIVIGGSAAVSWYVAVLGDEGAEILRTKDVDFQIPPDTPRPVIEAFADAVGGRVHWPTIDDHTPEIAVVEIPDYFGSGESLGIDFLPGVHGLSAQETNKHAEYVAHQGEKGETVGFRVIHPVHVACNIIESYLKLQRRDEADVQRRRSILPVIRIHIAKSAMHAQHTGDDETADDARWSIRALLERSNSVDYARFHHNTGVDLLDAIPNSEEAPIEGAFWDQEYPRLVAAVEHRRKKLRNRLRNTGQVD